jgi:porphobilinogen synthase
MLVPRQFPQTRMRRLRSQAFTRNLVRENQLTPHDLIYPAFVLDGQNREEAVASMPESGHSRPGALPCDHTR